MEKLNKKEKEIIYRFKRYCRSNGIWEIYKKNSNALKRLSFIEVVRTREPVTLLQNAIAFCDWSKVYTKERGNGAWAKLSAEWALICLQHNLFHDKEAMLMYAIQHVSLDRGVKFKLNMKYKELVGIKLDY